MTADNVKALLRPESIAVIGASQHAHKPGAVLVRSLIEGGFGGRVHPIHPKADIINDRQCYASVGEVPEQVDLAFVVLARESVRAAVEQCAAAGVRAVAIISAGFGESDDWGVQEQAAIAEIIERAGMAAIGPNTIGLVTMGGQLRGSFVQFKEWHSGPVALAAQSGVFAGAVAEEEMARTNQRLGICTSVSVGNRIRTSEADLVEAFGDDPQVEVIGLYLESFADAEGFLRKATEVKQNKPVVVLKGGRTAQGSAAAASHTGSLAADDSVVDQLLQQHGIVRARNEEDFLALLKGFSYGPRKTGRNVGMVTFSGAFGVLAADELELAGLELVPYTEETLDSFRAILPAWQRPRNPADLWPAIDLDPKNALIDGLGAALRDPNTEQVLGIVLAVDNADFDDMHDAFAKLRAELPEKPLHLVITGGLRERWVDALEGLSIPVYPSVSAAVRVMGATAWYQDVRETVPSAYAAPLEQRKVNK